MIVNSTDFKTNLGKYLDQVENEDIFILRSGKPVAKMVSYTYLTDSDLLKENADAYDYKMKAISYQEFIERYDNAEERMEYIDGVVYALGSPSVKHQKVVMELSYRLYHFLKGRKCQPFVAPLDVHFENTDLKSCVQPDLLVICDEENVRDGKYYGVPTMVIEILSLSSKSKDTIIKLNLYWREGVKEYLLVDPMKQILYYWSFENKEIVDQKTLTDDDVFSSNALEGFSVCVKDIF